MFNIFNIINVRNYLEYYEYIVFTIHFIIFSFFSHVFLKRFLQEKKSTLHKEIDELLKYFFKKDLNFYKKYIINFKKIFYKIIKYLINFFEKLEIFFEKKHNLKFRIIIKDFFYFLKFTLLCLMMFIMIYIYAFNMFLTIFKKQYYYKDFKNVFNGSMKFIYSIFVCIDLYTHFLIKLPIFLYKFFKKDNKLVFKFLCKFQNLMNRIKYNYIKPNFIELNDFFEKYSKYLPDGSIEKKKEIESKMNYFILNIEKVIE